MNLRAAVRFLPAWKNVLLAVLASVLLILAFPPFEFWFTAWFALVPLLWAIEREGSVRRSFILGWLFGNIFFFGTCWWLTFAPITYAGFPSPLAYLLLFCVTSVAAVFLGLFGAILKVLILRFGTWAILVAPFVWAFAEFLRYWLTGNNWNAIGYSKAFVPNTISLSAVGGVYMVGFQIVGAAAVVKWFQTKQFEPGTPNYRPLIPVLLFGTVLIFGDNVVPRTGPREAPATSSKVVSVQPNVPMAGLNQTKWNEYRRNHIRLAETALSKLSADSRQPTTVVFPESPMNFMYEDDPETREFINGFAAKHNVSVLFNSAEPDASNGKYFNSAVLVGPDGKEAAQYDKIYLLPFGEAVPFPLGIVMPAFVGSFSYGKEYDLLPLGEAKAGVMICFESHFGQLSREYVRNGADVIIEMTNDGYLGPTPVLRQHLANAVFRAVETNRPVLRVTNVGITAYVNERGEVLDAAESYVEDTRVWSVARSDGSQTVYVKYGDWFAWLCSMVTLCLLGYAILRRVPLGDRS